MRFPGQIRRIVTIKTISYIRKNNRQQHTKVIIAPREISSKISLHASLNFPPSRDKTHRTVPPGRNPRARLPTLRAASQRALSLSPFSRSLSIHPSTHIALAQSLCTMLITCEKGDVVDILLAHREAIRWLLVRLRSSAAVDESLYLAVCRGIRDLDEGLPLLGQLRAALRTPPGIPASSSSSSSPLVLAYFPVPCLGLEPCQSHAPTHALIRHIVDDSVALAVISWRL